MLRQPPQLRALSLVCALAFLATGCGDDEPSFADAIATYASGVHASYSASLASATEMDAAIDAFVADPTDATLDTARRAWLTARDDYGRTEAFRFSAGPIDSGADAIEGLVNAWPLDEAYIDEVEGSPGSGIVNNPADHPTIDGVSLAALNELGGETNVATGWHAIEFLLWGQDRDPSGPGARPVSDYVDAPNADRRAAYLVAVTDLLIEHLDSLVAAWAPDASDNYRARFMALDHGQAMARILTGIGELGRGELAGERMNVAYSQRSEEDEHSCFSDNTTADLVANADGIRMVLTASYPGADADGAGTSVLEVIADVDADLAADLAAQVDASVAAVAAIPAPFDQHLRDDVADDDPGRASILTGIEALEAQTATLIDAADQLGIALEVS
jgi:putative iron-regulated protein